PDVRETRVRMGLLTLGVRFHLVTLFHRHVEQLKIARQTSPGSGLYWIPDEPTDVERVIEYLGAGLFARGNAFCFTVAGTKNTDPRTLYDPYAEGGLFVDLSPPFEWAGSLELTAGVAASLSSGTMLFGRIEVLLVGYRLKGEILVKQRFRRIGPQ